MAVLGTGNFHNNHLSSSGSGHSLDTDLDSGPINTFLLVFDWYNQGTFTQELKCQWLDSACLDLGFAKPNMIIIID